MGRETGISWCDSTWNPIRGCSRVSEGCRNCYAEGYAMRFGGPGLAYEGLVRIGANGKPQGWNGAIRFVEEHLLDPLKWRTVKEHVDGCDLTDKPSWCRCPIRPRRIFVNSMSDLFHEAVTDEMRDRIFAVMALCPQHIFQVLTKRPERMLTYFNRSAGGDCEVKIGQAALPIANATKNIDWDWSWRKYDVANGKPRWPLPNVWLGVSVENQKTADERIPLLLQTPAAVRFISAEPLLGAVNAEPYLGSAFVVDASQREYQSPGIDWVIVGGESGPHARPIHPDWARSLRDQCSAAGVPFFFKQWGAWAPWASLPGNPPPDDADVWLTPTGKVLGSFLTNDAACMRRVGTKAAGHLLDGVEHPAFPGGR